MRDHIFDLTPLEFATKIIADGESGYRSDQVYYWVFKRKILDVFQMNHLPKVFREYLKENFIFSLPKVVGKLVSKDGSTKYLLDMEDTAKIEMVLIPIKDKNTLCISSQVGCGRNCRFCATGKIGMIRNLKVYEILQQVYLAILELGENKLTNIVFMGMGEPLDNYDNVIKAIRILQNEKMFSFSPRRITISTSGVIPGILRLASENLKVKLAVSLNAAEDEKRDYLMPINKSYNLQKLKNALLTFSHKNPYRITFEYVMIKNFNMGNKDIKNLIKLGGDLRCKINLIPWNRVKGIDFQAPTDTEINLFRQKLNRINKAVTMRLSRGKDINAACGQLAGNYLNKSKTNA